MSDVPARICRTAWSDQPDCLFNEQAARAAGCPAFNDRTPLDHLPTTDAELAHSRSSSGPSQDHVVRPAYSGGLGWPVATTAGQWHVDERAWQCLSAQRAAILDALPANIALLDGAGIIVAVNARWRRFLQDNGSPEFARDAYVGVNYVCVCEAAAQQGDVVATEVRAGLRDILAGQRERFEIIYPCHGPNRTDRWFRMLAVPGQPGEASAGVVVMHIDITAFVKAQTAVEEREARLASILETVPDAMVIFDGEGNIEAFSAAAERTFGWPAADVIGRPVSMLMVSPDQEPSDGFLDTLGVGGEQTKTAARRVVSGLRMNGSAFPIELSIGEVRTGGRHFFTCFARDLTEWRSAQTRLQELNAELLHVSRRCEADAMASALAHELNQPLTSAISALRGARRLLARPGWPAPMSEELREAFDLAAEQAFRARKIIRNLREFVSRGDRDRRPEKVPQLIENVSALALAGTGAAGVHLTLALEPALPDVCVNRVQIQQVLFNLLRNAIQAMTGESGTNRDVPVPSRHHQLTVSAAAAGTDRVEIAVSDTGPGLAPEIVDRLFEPFVTTKPDGMGVGLSICRSIIEAHGGRLWAEGNTNGGATFRFTLATIDSWDTTEPGDFEDGD